MFSGFRSSKRFAVAFLTSGLAAVLAVSAAAPLPAAAAAPSTTFVGPLLGAVESPTFTVGRDVGMSVALPNGRDLWVFGDTPTYGYANNAWAMKSFVTGSTAAESAYATGQSPAAMYEINLGHALAPTNQPSRFIPSPTNVYMPDGSGKLCTPANGALESGRWPVGAALMPDQLNVLIAYVDTCVPAGGAFTEEGWGFMEYNWKTRTISVAPTDVFAPATSGAPISRANVFTSPVILNNQVTFFATTCCSPGVVYTATMAATTAALANPNSYILHAVAGLRPALTFGVTVERSLPPKLQLVAMNDLVGNFDVFSAPNPAGPWTQEASGTLPGCASAPTPCYSMYGHPELSTPSQLLVSYYRPGYGPGIHLHPAPALSHIVFAAVTVGAPAPPLRPLAVRAISRGTITKTGALTVTYQPGLNNGAEITKYVATCKSPNGGVTRHGAHYGASATPINVAGVNTAKSYTCSVRATNARGTSPGSAASRSIVGAPGAPSGAGAASVAPGRLEITFTPGANNGALVTKYDATCASADGGVTRHGARYGSSAAPISVIGATIGKSYMCSVRATNKRGISPSSPRSLAVIA